MSLVIERARLAANALMVVGGASIVNGFLASCLQAEKSYSMQHYTNTHWITTVSIFAGLSACSLRSFSTLTHSLALMIATNLFAMTIAAAALLADVFNIFVILRDFQALSSNLLFTRLQVYGMLSYSVVDFLLCTLTVVLVVMILSACVGGVIETQLQLRSSTLLVLGISLTIISAAKLFAWIFELYWLRSLGNIARYTFLHYTIDEPIWIAINIVTGILCTMSCQGGALLRAVCFCLSSLSIHSTVMYLWIDYRWFSNAVVASMNSQKHSPGSLFFFNISLGCTHTILLIAISLILVTSISQPIDLKLSSKLRLFLFLSGITAGAVSVLLLLIDVISANLEAFYRMFHGTEQKTPFLVLMSAALLLLATRSPTNHFVLPALVTSLLLCVQSTGFLLVAYNYLSWNGYFSGEICELFFHGAARCTHLITRTAATVHFFEAILHAFVLVTSAATVFIVLRVIQMYAPSMPQLSNFQMKQAEKYERIIQRIGVIFLVAGVIVFSSTVFEFVKSRARHPLIVLLSTLYHTSIGTTLIIIPLYQVTVSRMILKNPLSCVSLVMVNAVRFVEVLTQLDYRNIGETANFSWRLHNTVEIAALGAHFVTIMLCLRIAELVNGTLFSTPMDSLEGFNNPLSLDSRTPQYAQITQNGFES
uniref:G-protein coupled receptors family 1 profile domain-containing protein n=1 Tax=Ascaris lumbricoides TaxID=6252 RepID=A0A9J2PKR8_ASCLU